ncbi:MAG: winged helix-turn-helix domain-containing protein [Alphaproteobacteria bacterium]|nr:winged helix-turn-helix domain-containing protein [Alphaproteobacteria bacterium]
MATPTVSNKQARNLLLHLQGLTAPPRAALSKQGLLEMIQSIGFVQVDSIQTVERAHHMILFARNQTYRPKHLKHLLEKDGELFENWTHDASIIPSAFYRYWRHRFAREELVLAERWRRWNRTGFEEKLGEVLSFIEENGCCMSRDLGGDAPKASGGWWDWHPSKAALEYLWRTGALAVARRDGFQKVYDIPRKVIAPHHMVEAPEKEAFTHWACTSALDRLGFATHGEIAAFWELISPAEAKAWCERQSAHDLIQVEVESADGSKPKLSYTRPGYEEVLADLPLAPARLRVLSPFDPLIRDRKRTLRLFNFDYRIEIFVPESKRKYGYYVFPLLEGDRLVGRIDIKHDRKEKALITKGLWFEPKIRASVGRRARLDAELERIRRFTGAETLVT